MPDTAPTFPGASQPTWAKEQMPSHNPTYAECVEIAEPGAIAAMPRVTAEKYVRKEALVLSRVERTWGLDVLRQRALRQIPEILCGAPGKGSCKNVVFHSGRGLMANILIVEDDPYIRQNAGLIMEDLGFDVLLARNLEEALVHLAASGPIDALFVDIRLQALALGGYDVANRAITLRPGLKVLYTSGSPMTPDMTNRFVVDGRFLQKPYSKQQLEFSVGQLLK